MPFTLSLIIVSVLFIISQILNLKGHIVSNKDGVIGLFINIEYNDNTST
jgi:hypothetical protein